MFNDAPFEFFHIDEMSKLEGEVGSGDKDVTDEELVISEQCKCPRGTGI